MPANKYYHVVAIRSGDRRKSVVNRTDDEVLAQFVMPFGSSGTIKAKWRLRLAIFFGRPFTKLDDDPRPPFHLNRFRLRQPCRQLKLIHRHAR